MHRVDFKKRRKLVLRIVAYVVMTSLTLITTAVLLLAALGYRLGGDGEVIKSGLLLVNSKPVSAQVYINGADKGDRTDSRFVLPAGKYDISLRAEGYREWEHSVSLLASTVENFYYPFLIPEKLEAKSVQRISTPTLVSQSPNKESVLLYNQSSGALQLMKLDTKDPKITNLTLPTSFIKVGDSHGSLSVIEWSRDNGHVLVQQSVNDTTRWLSIDTVRPTRSVDITAIAASSSLSDLHYARNDGAAVYARRGAEVIRLNVENGEIDILLSRIKQYEPYGEKTLSFVRSSIGGKEVEGGVWRDGSVAVVHKAKINSSARSGVSIFTSFNGADYVALQLADEKKVTLYRNPLKEPVLSTQLPYSNLSLASVKDLRVSPNGQFILAQNGEKLAVYDLEHDRQRAFTQPKNTKSMEWVDSHHLQYKTKAGMNYISDFDGTNEYELVTSSYGPILFSDDYESIYRIQKVSSQANLQNMSLLVNN